ncbi:Dyp-type peroxidase [Streptomyces sp. NBC_01233]|uniref:Dyp-type peroxidase n=1 Tax=Streptomyces sp. NBC_01233 TaxID=2903787 RepID=UPI002E0F94D1|nr:Dyp-type peroxidase [Streptomyces sp. NBC_01233]
MTTLQDGIYHAKGCRPPGHLALVFLRANPGADAPAVDGALREVTALLRGLAEGRVAELPGHPVPTGELKFLLGFGPKAFEIPGGRLKCPTSLGPGFRFRSPDREKGGGPLLVGGGLPYASDVFCNDSTEEFCLQLTAETQLAVSRAVVELWKLFDAGRDGGTRKPALEIAGVHTGFQRDDLRSWIGFHDGVSNLESNEREGVITIGAAEAGQDTWTVGGTYLVFLRLAVDLGSWHLLPRAQQELLVGRDKLTGAPLTGTDPEGRPVPAAGCPVPGTTEVTQAGNEDFHQPGPTDDPVLLAAHVRRANLAGTADPELGGSLRVFRQGHEFFEPIPDAPGFRVGLNFISFQDNPDRVLRILTQRSWLGGINFGGQPGPDGPAGRLLTVRAGGTYLVPPRHDAAPYPGAEVFA